MHKHIRELKDFCESIGIKCEVTERNNGHLGLILKNARGDKTTMIVGKSISDHRAYLNNRCFIKRFARKSRE